MSWTRHLSLDLLGLYVLTVVYIVARAVVPGALPRELVFLLPLSTVAFFGFSLSHAVSVWGWPRALLFLGITFAVSLLLETVGVLTGWVYGPYVYTGRLGPQLFGLVPVFIPMAWFMMGYCAYSLAEQLATSLAIPTRGWGHVWVALTAAIALTAWDLTMDPLMVAGGHWRWLREGGYFGIPAQNFVGWVVTGFAFTFLYRVAASRLGCSQPASPSRAWRLLPGWVYTFAGLSNIVTAAARGMTGPAVAGFFGMAPFVLAHVAIALAAPERAEPSAPRG